MVADVHTGGMVALVPDEESARQLALADGEPHDRLHLTLAYLGDDVGDMTDAERAELTQQLRTAAATTGPLLARVFAHATFNPDSWADREPCAVYLVGDCPELAPLAARFAAVARVPQHDPFVPHVTAGVGQFFRAGDLHYTGPIVFDRLRLALGEDVVDEPLTGELLLKGIPQPPSSPREQFAAGLRYGLDGLADDDHHLGADIAAEVVELKAGPPGHTFPSPDPGATRLRRWWTRTTEGLRRWRPGEPGAYKRLVRALRKHVGARAEGLAAIYYRTVKGHWPGRHGNRDRKTAATTVDQLMLDAVQELRAGGREHKGGWADEEDDDVDDEEDEEGDNGPDPLLASLDGYAELDATDMVTTTEAWNDAIAADVEWTADADGTLRRPDGHRDGDQGDRQDTDEAADMVELFDDDEDEPAASRR